MSFPLWERGLKQALRSPAYPGQPVVPLVGTWIETVVVRFGVVVSERSFPLWERGLKPERLSHAAAAVFCRSPCGNVD